MPAPYVSSQFDSQVYIMNCCDLKRLICHNDVFTVVLFFSNICQPAQSLIPSNNQLCVFEITRAYSKCYIKGNWIRLPPRIPMTWTTKNLHQQPELIFSFPHLTIQSFHLISGQVGFRRRSLKLCLPSLPLLLFLSL